MEYFLEKIAKSLYSEFGNTLNRHCLVFPGRRAGLYLMKYLAQEIKQPVWVPVTCTINELFGRYSPYKAASNELLLFELYKTYRHLKQSPESFDDFYFWGDMLLNDFDDVDKYMADAAQLFANITDLKNIDKKFGGLTDEQIEVIRRFWVNFDGDRLTREKSGFIDIWSVIHDIYLQFRKTLAEKNLAYEGMLFRELAENRGDDFYETTEWDLIHFIGFNALNECEKKIMKGFRRAGKARFYWDYDNSYIREGDVNSAGYFMRDNLKMFGNDMPQGWSYDTMLSAPASAVRRRVIESSSDVAQVKLLTDLVADLPELSPGTAHHTAIVLADENLLMPVLTSLPEDSGDINITMGYPLKQTMVYTLVRLTMDLQRTASGKSGAARFGFREVLAILKHPLIAGLPDPLIAELIVEINSRNLLWIAETRFSASAGLKTIFRLCPGPAELSAYYRELLIMLAQANEAATGEEGTRTVAQNILNEYIYRILLAVNRFEPLAKDGAVSFTAATYLRILDRLLRIQSVPFSGEPLSGIQIMGILETRALDFRNLIILSVNEGVLPAISAGSSFIPYSLREAFGLPSINHQESIFAYHFYRLQQRAEDVTFLYNSGSDGLRTGEMSRFLVQMKYDTKLAPVFRDLGFEIRSHGTISDTLNRTEAHNALLHDRFLDPRKGRYLSPSAINTWLGCSMRFYYRYVCGLREPETVSKDIDPALLGEILHAVMKTLYEGFSGKPVSEGDLDRIARDRELIESTISGVIDATFSNDRERTPEGSEYIVRDVVAAYTKSIIKTDKTFMPLTIHRLESELSFSIGIIIGEAAVNVVTGGIVDRVDSTGGTVRIVDYKTGSVAERIDAVESLFEDDRKKELDGWLQTLLYCEAWLASEGEVSLRPSVYRIRRMAGSSDDDRLKIKSEGRNFVFLDDYRTIRTVFVENLRNTITRIFSPGEPFRMSATPALKCSWCPYRGLCLRY